MTAIAEFGKWLQQEQLLDGITRAEGQFARKAWIASANKERSAAASRAERVLRSCGTHLYESDIHAVVDAVLEFSTPVWRDASNQAGVPRQVAEDGSIRSGSCVPRGGSYTGIPGFPSGAVVEIPRAYTGKHKDAWIDGFNKAREMFAAKEPPRL